MPYTQPHQYILMQNMQQKSPGQSRLMTSSRKFKFLKLKITCRQLFLLVCLPVFISSSMKFIRYADRANAYWTGYFTSRPALKLYTRVMSAYYLVNSCSYISLCP